MSKFKYCRICLDNNVRMQLITGSEVEDVYEKLTKNKIYWCFSAKETDLLRDLYEFYLQIQDDGKLHFACYICYCQLKNSQQLVIKSQKSEELLKQISVNTPELNLKTFPFLDRLLCGLQNPLIVADIVSLQIPEYNENIKTENQADSDTKETCNTSEPDDDRAPPNRKPTLDEKYKANSIETETTKNISGIETKTVPNKNKSYQLLYDGNNKQVLVQNEEKTFICDDCSKTCYSKALLITHIRGHKAVMIKQNKAYINIHKSKSDGKCTVHDNVKKEFKCQYCNYISLRRDNLNDHIKTHTGEKPFKCQYCSYTCAENTNLKVHSRTHTGDKPFKCQYCSYTCTANSILKIHIRTHTGEKPFKCQYCSYTCIEKRSLREHIRTHTGEKPFKCQYCSFTCARNGDLRKHIITHTGEKPFKCQYCSYTCARNDSLKIHIRTHTGENLFKCQYCPYTCTVKTSLKSHIRTHTGEKPFKCQFCSYKSTVKSGLKSHIRTHTGEKPFKCQYCNYTCATTGHLNRHTRRIHARENSYICEICDKKFKAGSALKKHLRVHMDNNSR